MIKILVNGSSGQMGKTVITALREHDELKLVGAAGRNDDLGKLINETNAELVIDFTHPSVAFENSKIILSNGAYAVVGTTGIKKDEAKTLDELARSNELGILIAPNFSIGAILMMQYAAQAAKYMPNVEIVEYHHDHKADAPSGTAIKTAEYINSIAGPTEAPIVESKEQFDRASQGARIGNIRIHAIRLPGFVASQEVILGDRGQVLKIRHDAINRESFIPGVILGVKKILHHKGLIYGLENFI